MRRLSFGDKYTSFSRYAQCHFHVICALCLIFWNNVAFAAKSDLR